MAASLTNAQVNMILDNLSGIAYTILNAYGQRTAGDPIATWPASGIALAQKDFEDTFLADILDLEASNALGPSIYQLRGNSRPEVVASNYCSDLISRLTMVIQGMNIAAGVVSLDQYLAYYNTGLGGTNLTLQSPVIRWIMESIGLAVTKNNFCYVAYSAGLHVGSQTGAAFTAGTRTVDTAKYVGGIPKLKHVTWNSDNGAVTVTGECWNPATQAIEVGKTWVTTGGSFTAALEERDLIPGGGTPAPANALMIKATAMAGINAGNRMDARLYAPAGRSFDEWVV